jgi:hypothetical protein
MSIYMTPEQLEAKRQAYIEYQKSPKGQLDAFLDKLTDKHYRLTAGTSKFKFKPKARKVQESQDEGFTFG